MKNEIQRKRYGAIKHLLALSNSWNEQRYCDADFEIDRILRKQLNQPAKKVGKPPYEYLESYN